MKVGIDISPIIYHTGVSRYILNLVEALLLEDKSIEYRLLGYSLRNIKEFKNTFSDIKGNYSLKLLNFPPLLADLIFNRIHKVNIEHLLGNIDVFHSSDWIEPPSKCPKVTTVHDVLPLLYPEYSLPKIVSVHKAKYNHVKKESQFIITPSVFTKSEIIRLGINENKIFVIPEAPDAIFSPQNNKIVDQVKKKYGISGSYLISIGVTPRKNCKRIIEAFDNLRKNGEFNNLIILGERKIDIKPSKGVKFLGRGDDADMPALYSGSSVLVYPSLYEGFGLPILEAYACKTPVVTSNIGAMKETAGGFSSLANPFDVNSIEDAIVKAKHKSSSEIDKAYVYAKSFNWKKTAQKTLDIYKLLCT